MIEKRTLRKEILRIALPITAQCLFQASLGFIDQFMVGSLGETQLAASGLGSKFFGLFNVTLSAVAATAAILISQYAGCKQREGINKSFYFTSYISVFVALLFMIPSVFCSRQVMSIYTKDKEILENATLYLKVIGYGYLFVCGTMMLSSLLRSMKQSKYPMYTSILSIILNISGNYIFIFGKLGFPKLGLEGAAIATTVSRFVEFVVLFILFVRWNRKTKTVTKCVFHYEKDFLKEVTFIIAPILMNEFLWSLGENVYAGIYGRMGRVSLAAMTMTYPIQGLFISGVFTGVSTAAGVMVGNRLGRNAKEEAYEVSKYILKIGYFGSLLMGLILIIISHFYVNLPFFKATETTRQTAIYILYAFGILLFSKVCNMILGGGILRSGGKTKITLIVDLIGTWGIGIPVGLITSNLLHWPIYFTYFCLTLEECVRLFIELHIFKSRIWMKSVVKSDLASDSLQKNEEYILEKA